MNIAYLLTPKHRVAFLYDDNTMRQGLEKLRHHGRSAVPVINRKGQYVGTVSEGDFLWYILIHNQNLDEITLKSLEHMTVRDILQCGKVNPACIDTSMESLLEKAKRQNFVPVIDDRNVFIGIVKRSDIIRYFVNGTK